MQMKIWSNQLSPSPSGGLLGGRHQAGDHGESEGAVEPDSGHGERPGGEHAVFPHGQCIQHGRHGPLPPLHQRHHQESP